MTYTVLVETLNPAHSPPPPQFPSVSNEIKQNYGNIANSVEMPGRLRTCRSKDGFHKHWWNSKLDDVKQRCIDINNCWLININIEHLQHNI